MGGLHYFVNTTILILAIGFYCNLVYLSVLNIYNIYPSLPLPYQMIILCLTKSNQYLSFMPIFLIKL